MVAAQCIPEFHLLKMKMGSLLLPDPFLPLFF